MSATDKPQDPGARWYCTRYQARDGKHYGDSIWAESLAQAERHCLRRGIGEKIDGHMGSKSERVPYKTPSEMLRGHPSRFDWRDLLHCATHICHLALAGVLVAHKSNADPEFALELLDDHGALHDLIHLWGLWQQDDKCSRKERIELRKRLIADFTRIERQIPGLRSQ